MKRWHALLVLIAVPAAVLVAAVTTWLSHGGTHVLRDDPTTITFRLPSRPDRLFAHGRFEADHEIDLTSVAVGISLTDTSGVLFTATLPSGALVLTRSTAAKKIYEFRNTSAKLVGGLARFWVLHDRYWYRLRVQAYGDISAAAAPSLPIVGITIGAETYESAGPWIDKGRSRVLKPTY